jgi:hypothetical protein
MSDKRMKTRIVNKHAIESDWAKAINFIPLKGELIVYDIDENHTHERIKIGDGVQNVNSLPFYAGSWEELSDRPFYVDTVENTYTLIIKEQSSGGGTSEDTIFAKLLYENYENCVYEVFRGGGWVAGTIESIETTDVHLSIEISCLLESGNTLGHTVQIANDYSYIDWFRATELSGSQIRFTVTATEEIVNKIDPKYLPNGGQSDWLVNDNADPAYIQNRPFYEIEAQNYGECNWAYGSKTLDTDTLSFAVQYGTDYKPLGKINATFTIVDDPTAYNAVFVGFSDVFENGCVATLSTSAGGSEWNMFVTFDYTTGTATVSANNSLITGVIDATFVCCTDYELKQLDAKYLPNSGQSDWNQTDPTQADYIKNKPFYEVPYTAIGSLCFVATPAINTIEYTLDGTANETYVLRYLQSKSGQSNTISVHLNGDSGFVTPVFSYGRFSFSEYLSGNGFYFATGETWTVTVNSDAVSLVAGQTYEVEFYDVTTPDVTPIDEKYLPTSVHIDSTAPVRHGNVEYSAVQGKNTVAKANYAHAEGYGTIAASHYQHVQGRYNIEESEERYLHIVGNGHSDTSRSNAHTLDDNGNAWFQGDIFIGGTGQDDPATKKIATEEYIIESKDFFILKDQISGCDYVLQIKDGNLVTFSRCTKIEVTTPPNKTSYVQGEAFDPTGMVVTTTYGDGTTEVFDNYQCSDAVMGDVFYIYYQEYGVTHSAAVNVEVTEFDPETELVDFDYVANEDGTYTLTGWKGTLNGVSSTELIVPANGLINIDGGDAL